MEGWRCQVSGRPDSVAIFLPWSVEGQCVNNNGVCLPGRLDQNLSVESGSVFWSARRDELPIWELMPEPVVMGRGWGRITRDRQQIVCESILYPTQRDHGLMKEEGREGGGCLASVTRLRRLIGSWLTHTHPHTDAADSQVICLVIEEILCVCERERVTDRDATRHPLSSIC